MMLLERISNDFQLPQSYIVNIARSASFQYQTFEIPKKGGGTRTIHHPAKPLKALQRWLLANVIVTLPIDDSALAYRKGLNILDNAIQHALNSYLLRIDFLNFFPSITDQDIRSYIAQYPSLCPGWLPEDVELFCSLTCRFKKLTIGAPTSPSLSNALCRQMDINLKRIADDRRVIYTRYADDLFFSTDRPNVLRHVEADVFEAIESLKLPSRLRINKNKTRHFSRKRRRSVTGITLTSDGRTSLGRKLKRQIRSYVYKVESLDDGQRHYLAGYLAYCRSIEPDFVNSLILKYGYAAVAKAQNPHI